MLRSVRSVCFDKTRGKEAQRGNRVLQGYLEVLAAQHDLELHCLRPLRGLRTRELLHHNRIREETLTASSRATGTPKWLSNSEQIKSTPSAASALWRR